MCEEIVNEMLPKAGVCEKRQGGGCHEGPCSRRLRKGEGWQQEAVCKESCRKATDCGTTPKANAEKGCERKRRPRVGRRRKRKLEKAMERRKLPREAQKRQCATGAATGSRVPEGCAKRRMLPKATVCRRLRKRRTPAEDCERGKRRRKQPCATKAATSSRVPEDCGMRLLPNATVCERL